MTEKGFFGYMGMNLVNPDATSHTLQIVPRYYPDGDVLIRLQNKATKGTVSITVTPLISGGYLYVTFAHIFMDRSDYSIIIEEGSDCLYRGKIFATTQYNDTQNYKISNGIFNE